MAVGRAFAAPPLAVFLGAAIFAQSADLPRFEVAAIKLSNADPTTSRISTGHGRLTAENVTLKRCIMGAYRISPRQILGGPDWLDSDRFDIVAKADQPAGDHALMEMLQTLLADRFKLAFHHETRTISALVLEVAKNGPKLEKSAGGESSTNGTGSNLRHSFDARNTSMDQFAEQLGRRMETPVVNRTGLDGVFNFRLEWMSEAASQAKPDSAVPEGPSIFTAIQEQLGLRLHAEKAPVEVLVIDHVEKPSEN